MREIKYIFIHTAAHARAGLALDTTAAQIDEWHKANGWEGIGYHYVIRLNGQIEEGRALEKAGAHVKGFNANSIGICLSGHGDISPMTIQQEESLKQLLQHLKDKYPKASILGHNEVNTLTTDPKYRTNKTCPGTKISMPLIREFVEQSSTNSNSIPIQKGFFLKEAAMQRNPKAKCATCPYFDSPKRTCLASSSAGQATEAHLVCGLHPNFLITEEI
mgnify:FL=1